MKRLLACLLIFCIAPVSAFASLPATDRIYGNQNFKVNTDKADVFRIDGYDGEFILLDAKDNQYFITTKEDYGNHVFDPDNTQKFDVTDKNNIAYWLNNDFKSKGNGNKKLPAAITEFINDNAQWETEAGLPNSNCPDGYNFTAGISFLSQTELLKYKEKLGVKDNIKSASGWWLRTARGINNPTPVILNVRVSPTDIGQTHGWNPSDTIAVRPVFYLNNDFFTKVKLNVSTVGTNVKRQLLKSYTPQQLKQAGYSDEELQVILDVSSVLSEKVSINFKGNLDLLISKPFFSFNVDFLISTEKPKQYEIQYNIDGGKYTSVKVIVYPGYKKNEVININGLQKGVHKVNVQVKDGIRVADEVTRAIAVIKEYTPQFMEDFAVHGMGTHYSLENQSGPMDLELLKKVGVKTIRDELSWQKTEKTKGVFDYSRHDGWVKPLDNACMGLIGVLSYSNTLYNKSTSSDKVAPKSQEEIDAFVNYALNMAKHYPNIRKFEIWNEPNISFWLPEPNVENYINLVKAVSTALKAYDPTLEILAGSLAGTRTTYVDYLTKMFELGVYPYIDAISYHPYIYGDALADEKFDWAVGTINEVIEKFGGFKDTYITEIGWPTHVGFRGSTEERQAIESVKQYVIADAGNVEANYLYTFRNTGLDPTYNEDNFGLVTFDFQPKPVFAAYNQFNLNTAGSVFYGEANIGEGAKAYIYQKDGKPLMMAWALKENAKLDLSKENATAEDLYGNTIAFNGELNLVEAQSYIKGLSNAWFVKTSADNLKKLYEKWFEKWGQDEVLNNLYQFSKDMDSKVLTDDLVLEKLKAHYRKGNEIINKKGKTTLEKMQMLNDLHLIGQHWSKLYSTLVAPDYQVEILSSETLKTAAKMLGSTKENCLQYSEELLRNAKSKSKYAQQIKDLKQDNPSKSGLIAANDVLAMLLAEWSLNFSKIEPGGNASLNVVMPSDENGIYNGQTKKIHMSINNFGEERHMVNAVLYNDKMTQIGIKKNIYLNPKKNTGFDIPITVKGADTTGSFGYTIRLETAEGILKEQKLTFNVKYPVSMKLKTADSAMKVVKVNLTNPFAEKLEGVIELTPPNGVNMASRTVNYTLKPNESKDYEFAVNSVNRNDFNEYVFRIKVISSTGNTLIDIEKPLSFTSVIKGTPDESLESWKGAYPVYLNWGNKNTSAKVITKWDEKYFYIRADVIDDYHVQGKQGVDIWNGDSLQISVDTLNSKTQGYDDNDYEYGFALCDSGPQVYAWQTGNGSDIGPRPAEWEKITRIEEEKLTRYFIKIPKENIMPLALENDSKFGLNITVNDSDMINRDGYIELTGGTASAKDPRLYETFILCND